MKKTMIKFEDLGTIPKWAFDKMNDGNIGHTVNLTGTIRGKLTCTDDTFVELWSTTGHKIGVNDLTA